MYLLKVKDFLHCIALYKYSGLYKRLSVLKSCMLTTVTANRDWQSA